MRASRTLTARRQHHSQAPQRAQQLAAKRAERATEKLTRLAERPVEVAS